MTRSAMTAAWHVTIVLMEENVTNGKPAATVLMGGLASSATRVRLPTHKYIHICILLLMKVQRDRSFYFSISQHAPRDILVTTAPSPVSVKMALHVIPSLGAAAVRLGSVETCARMVSCPPLSQNKQYFSFIFVFFSELLSCFLLTGCPKGFYGKQCNKKCNCANNGRCHRTYGACLCDPGLYGRFCHLRKSHCPDTTRLFTLNFGVRNSKTLINRLFKNFTRFAWIHIQ